MIAALLALITAGALALELPRGLVLLPGLPAVLWAPGLGWARRLSEDPLQRGLDAAWISVVACLPLIALSRWTGAPVPVLLGGSALVGLLGFVAGRGRGASPLASGSRWGLLAVFVAVTVFGMRHRAELSRPLSAWWHHPQAEQLSAEPVPWRAGEGLSEAELLGWPEVLSGRVHDPEGDGGTLRFSGEGRVLVLLRGPVGASLRIEDREARIQTDPVVVEDEGAVPRYLDAGITGLVVDAAPELPVVVEDAGPTATLYVLPCNDAVWSLHALGELQFVHYYQILNIVENQRWAQEMLVDRAMTVNQPPLWSNVLAVGVALAGADLTTANALLLGVLLLLGASGVRLLLLLAPRAPPPAWALPAALVLVHGRLMLVPGSTNFPDSLYAAAMVGGLLALKQPGAWRFGALAVLAGLLRYPGTIMLSLAALLAWPLLRRPPWRDLAWTWGLVGAIAAALALYAGATGQLQHWIEVLWFETVPEHYANNPEAPPLMERPPEFYWTWLRYTGFGLLATLPLAGRGARWVAATALVYSLMLCTIDHFSSHYFLPLVAWTGAAVGANAASLRSTALRWGLPLAALAGALVFAWRGVV